MVYADVLQCTLSYGSSLILIVIWRKKLGYRKVKVLLEILLISGAGVVIQLLYHPLLTTGFGMSLGILVLFITINNPHANIDTLTGLYNHLYLVRKSNELISAEKSISHYYGVSLSIEAH